MDDIRHLLPRLMVEEREYQHRDYPKWVTGPLGPVVVQDAEEEARIVAPRPAPEVVTVRRGRPPKDKSE